MHQNTNPVVIQDKNGKTTTVHRKNAIASDGSASAIPAPSLQTKLSPEDALRVFSSLGIELSDTTFGKENIAYLTGYPKVLEEVIEKIRESDDHTRKSLWAFKLGERVMHPDHEEDDYDYRKSYWRLVKTIPLATLLFPEKVPYGHRQDIENVVNLCDSKMGWPPGSKKYVETQAAMVAVVASGQFRNFEFKGRMDDIFFMADNFEKVIPLIPAILERGDTSQGYIKELLENESAALAEGLL
jgi:hypothetical protein